MLHNRTVNRFNASLVIAIATVLSITGIQNNTADAQQRRTKQERNAPETAKPTNSEQSALFSVQVSNVVEQPLTSRVRLIDEHGALAGKFDVPNGNATLRFQSGRYTALVDVYDNDVPILVYMEPIVLPSSPAPAIVVSLLEGSGSRNLAQFDRDLDLVLDRLELEQGSNPENASSTPGEKLIEWPSPVLSQTSAWYRGELHAYSNHGPGDESVANLIRRAESANLDFLAITDPNTIASALDPQYKSSKLVLIPAMEWGDKERGTALVYAPPSVLPLDVPWAEAQAEVIRLQARGGLIAVAHPTVPGGTWNWGLNMFNAVEVWWQGWRDVPPIGLSALAEQWRGRDESGDFLFPIATAAATQGLSGNAQSTIYYDILVTHLAKSCVIAGSGSAGRKQPVGSPVTYVYGREKSLKGILEGIRKGRTYVARGPDGPQIEFQADILCDGQVDVGMGGVVPINVKSRFIAGVSGAKGGRIDILMNGYPIRSRPIESDKLTLSLDQEPEAFGAFRMRIVTAPKQQDGYGFSEMLAMSSPIYAQSYYVEGGPDAGRDGWVDVKSEWQETRPEDEFDPSKLDPSKVVTLEPR